MDDISKAWFSLHFRNAYLEKKGSAFEEWFTKLAADAFGADFEPVRAYGSQGDWKCDGRQLSTATVFQCYAPETPTDKMIIAKIDKDFEGARAKWPQFMQRWVLVHNHPQGQPPTVLAHLDKKRSENPDVTIEIWAEEQLRELHERMSESAARALYGAVPNASVVSNLALEDLKPVIDVLEKRDLDHSDGDFTAPSVEKLEKNALSQEAVELLRLGRRKARLVEMFFSKTGPVERGERIAEAFRERYAELKSMALEPDRIFSYLQRFTGFEGDPKRQAAAMAVMAYFFDRCDIFEDPDVQAADL